MGIEISTLNVQESEGKEKVKYYIHLFVEYKKHSCLGVGNTETEVMENALKKISIIEKELKNAKETLFDLLGLKGDIS